MAIIQNGLGMKLLLLLCCFSTITGLPASTETNDQQEHLTKTNIDEELTGTNDPYEQIQSTTDTADEVRAAEEEEQNKDVEESVEEQIDDSSTVGEPSSVKPTSQETINKSEVTMETQAEADQDTNLEVDEMQTTLPSSENAPSEQESQLSGVESAKSAEQPVDDSRTPHPVTTEIDNTQTNTYSPLASRLLVDDQQPEQPIIQTTSTPSPTSSSSAPMTDTVQLEANTHHEFPLEVTATSIQVTPNVSSTASESDNSNEQSHTSTPSDGNHATVENHQPNLLHSEHDNTKLEDQKVVPTVMNESVSTHDNVSDSDSHLVRPTVMIRKDSLVNESIANATNETQSTFHNDDMDITTPEPSNHSNNTEFITTSTLQQTFQVDDSNGEFSADRMVENEHPDFQTLKAFEFDLPVYNQSLHKELMLNESDWAKELVEVSHPDDETTIHDPCTFISENIHNLVGLNVTREQIHNTLPTFKFLLDADTEDLTTIKHLLLTCVEATEKKVENTNSACRQIRSLITRTCQEVENCKNREDKIMYLAMERIRDVINTDQLADALLMIRACAGQTYD